MSPDIYQGVDYSTRPKDDDSVDFELASMCNSKEATAMVDRIGESLPELADKIKRGKQVVEYLYIFAHTKGVRSPYLQQDIYDAALIYGSFGDLEKDDPLSQAVLPEIHGYLEGVNQNGDLITKRMAIMADLVALSREVPALLDKYEDEGKESAGDCDKSIFAKQAIDVDWEDIHRAIDKAHVESVLIKGISLLMSVKQPLDGDDKLAQDIFKIESFYAQAVDALGFSALGSEMLSACSMRKLRELGRGDLVDKAKDIHNQARETNFVEIAELMFDIPGQLDMKWTVRQFDDDPERGLSSQFGKIPLGEIDGQIARAKARIKLPGQIAEKLRKKENSENYNLMDPVGFKVLIGDDNKENEAEQRRVLANTFSQVVANLAELSEQGRVEFTSTEPGVRNPLYAQCSTDSGFADILRSNIDSELLDIIQFEEFDGPAYEVIKIMATIDGVPCEIQFQTGVFHTEVKDGPYHHSFYKKQSDRRGDELCAKPLKEVRERRSHFGDTGLRVQSLAGLVGLSALYNKAKGLEA